MQLVGATNTYIRHAIHLRRHARWHPRREFVERWEDLRLLIAANQRAVRARKAAEARVAAVQAELERTRLQLVQEEQAQQEARSQLGSLADERKNLVELAAVHRRSVASQVARWRI